MSRARGSKTTYQGRLKALRARPIFGEDEPRPRALLAVAGEDRIGNLVGNGNAAGGSGSCGYENRIDAAHLREDGNRMAAFACEPVESHAARLRACKADRLNVVIRKQGLSGRQVVWVRVGKVPDDRYWTSPSRSLILAGN